jgi:hypothetical protein
MQTLVSDYAVVRGGRLPLVKASPYRVMPAILLVMPAQAGISYHLIVQGKSFPTPSPRGLAPKTPNVLTCHLERKSVPATTDTLDEISQGIVKGNTCKRLFYWVKHFVYFVKVSPVVIKVFLHVA